MFQLDPVYTSPCLHHQGGRTRTAWVKWVARAQKQQWNKLCFQQQPLMMLGRPGPARLCDTAPYAPGNCSRTSQRTTDGVLCKAGLASDANAAQRRLRY
jgi:hypothetical protein